MSHGRHDDLRALCREAGSQAAGWGRPIERRQSPASVLRRTIPMAVVTVSGLTVWFVAAAPFGDVVSAVDPAPAVTSAVTVAPSATWAEPPPQPAAAPHEAPSAAVHPPQQAPASVAPPTDEELSQPDGSC